MRHSGRRLLAALQAVFLSTFYYGTKAEAKCGPSPEAYCVSSSSPVCRTGPNLLTCSQCRTLATRLTDKVLFPNDKSYNARLDTYWSVSAALSPWCMVLPSTAEDVSTIIKTVVAGNCPFGIKGGGHGAFAGSNSVEHGVTIDFGNVSSID